jgi:hypothetical protein
MCWFHLAQDTVQLLISVFRRRKEFLDLLSDCHLFKEVMQLVSHLVNRSLNVCKIISRKSYWYHVT